MRSYTDGMTLGEQIGQVLMVGFWGDAPSQEIIDLIQRYRVGNIILFSRNIRDTRQVFELTESLQQIAREAGEHYPLLIAIDQENGLVQRLGEAATLFPGNMALGATGSEELACEVALATGRELKVLGINMNLAPVVDVNNNPANPVIGVRSFGEDPQQVAQFGAAMVRGYRVAGVLSCLKHFPGHGDTAVDSHLALPVIPYDLERLEALELVPFLKGIEAGADSVMIAHVAFPALTKQDKLPATLSRAMVQGLLRERVGFKGIILSDCLEMKAISETFGTERAAVLALQAGIDLVLVSHHYMQQRGSIEAILEAVQAGKLSPHVIRQAAERLLQLKAQRLAGDEFLSAADFPRIIGCEAHRRLRDRAYELSTTLVRNGEGLVPLRLEAGERILVLAHERSLMSMVEDRYYSDDVLVDALQEHYEHVGMLSIAPGTAEEVCEQVLRASGEADILIAATVNAHLDEQQAALVQGLVRSGRRTIGIAVRNPYDLAAFPELRTYLVTYEYTRPALVAAARVLSGESEPQGHLPVSMPGLYARGQAESS